MSLEENDSFVELTLDEVEKEHCYYDVLNFFIDHVAIRLKGAISSGIGVCVGNFTGNFTGRYCVKENGSGQTEGLFKLIDGKPVPITLPLTYNGNTEFKLWPGDGVTEIDPPPGWQLVTNDKLIRKYNCGNAPTWDLALIEYVGI